MTESTIDPSECPSCQGAGELSFDDPNMGQKLETWSTEMLTEMIDFLASYTHDVPGSRTDGSDRALQLARAIVARRTDAR